MGSRLTALTTQSATTPPDDLEQAKALAAALDVRHLVVEVDELAIPGYAGNPVNRCYLCKQHLFAICRAEAAKVGAEWVIDGVNRDDLGDHRPGLEAAREHGVRHPLAEAGLGKQEIRAASRALGLSSWDRPASPCLSSRFPYGTAITAERLAQVEAAERVLREKGFRELRVRYHGEVARIEVPAGELPRLLEESTRAEVVGRLKSLGFRYVTVDLQGFRSGSLNEGLPPHELIIPHKL